MQPRRRRPGAWSPAGAAEASAARERGGREASFVLARRHRLLQAVDGGAGGGGSGCRDGPAATGDGLSALLRLALPDAASEALDVLLAAEVAHVLCALLDLVALHDLPERRSIARAVLA